MIVGENLMRQLMALENDIEAALAEVAPIITGDAEEGDLQSRLDTIGERLRAALSTLDDIDEEE